MAEITRRRFIKLAGQLTVALGLAPHLIPEAADALAALASGQAPVLWLQGQSCSGCSVSFLNSDQPGPAEVLTGYVSVKFHSTLSAAEGKTAMDAVAQTTKAGGHILVVEGAVPAGMPEACLFGHRPFEDVLLESAQQCQAVVAIGSCAASGGIPAAEGNPTGAVSVPAFLKSRGLKKPIISLPGCPCHPDWLVGTLVHVLKFGLPPLDALGRPTAYYGRLIHEQCPRFADYEREIFAKNFGDPGCLFKLGCLGPVTKADCTVRWWNGRTNTCINAGAPCIGCAWEDFARSASMPFYRFGVQAGEESK